MTAEFRHRRRFLSTSAALAAYFTLGRVAQAREARVVASELLQVYGRKLDNNGYQQALAVIGRLQAAQANKDVAEIAQVQKLVAPFADGTKTPSIKSGPELAGHLVFAAVARSSDGELRTRCIDLVKRAAATLFINGELDRPRPPDPGEMSDAVFMNAPLLCEAGSLTQDERYYSAAIGFLRGMRDLCLRPDGIYRHSTLCDAAWGRGNGFPAIGVARCLERLPENHPGRGEVLTALQSHLQTLLKHQDAQGAWRQVIDRPDSYLEYSATAMIGWTMQRALQEKWMMGAEYVRAVQNAWGYIERKTSATGEVTGVCESTGKQKTVEDYLLRKAIQGRDERGGAMGLLFALSFRS